MPNSHNGAASQEAYFAFMVAVARQFFLVEPVQAHALGLLERPLVPNEVTSLRLLLRAATRKKCLCVAVTTTTTAAPSLMSLTTSSINMRTSSVQWRASLGSSLTRCAAASVLRCRIIASWLSDSATGALLRAILRPVLHTEKGSRPSTIRHGGISSCSTN